ncbi:MAG: phosphoglycerate mutase [bacterium]|nr:phosphoglycerate mutase [bacterium]
MFQSPDLDSLSTLARKSDDKILLVVIDGLGGLRDPKHGNRSELEYADLPHLTEFVRERTTATGLIDPVGRGIIPGSGAGHLGLFGYDPFVHEAKRGAIEAEGAGLDLAYDLVARVNFCKLDKDRKDVADRRAGRLGYSADRGRELAEKLNARIEVPNVAVQFFATRDHRALMTLKSQFVLDDNITNTDPGRNDLPIQDSRPRSPENSKEFATQHHTARAVQQVMNQAKDILAGEPDADMILLRGFAKKPKLKPFSEVFAVRPVGIALYPLYRGVARLLRMEVIEEGAQNLEDEIKLLNKYYDDYDFFFLHYKKTDLKGEDGDFEGKAKALSEFDKLLPQITQREDNGFSVIAITGDHSTPSVLGRHSEHPVPLAINTRDLNAHDDVEQFTERACCAGSLGRMRGIELMPTLMAAANKLQKFGD